MENLVGVGVADAAEKMGIGEGTLQRVIFARQPFAELHETRFKNLQTTRIMFLESGFAADQVN